MPRTGTVYIFALFSSLILFSGCSATYTHDVVKHSGVMLDRSKGVFISTPKNGWYGRTEYRDSGRMTANAVRAAFSRVTNSVTVSEECQSSACLKLPAMERYGYYVEPQILHWEDRATEWSGLPDKVEIKIIIYDAKAGTEIASSILTGRSKWATFGGDHPQDLLPEPVTKYVESLYGLETLER
jgi:uncharacterized protein DUF4823